MWAVLDGDFTLQPRLRSTTASPRPAFAMLRPGPSMYRSEAFTRVFVSSNPDGHRGSASPGIKTQRNHLLIVFIPAAW
jgi:hypothetical protein